MYVDFRKEELREMEHTVRNFSARETGRPREIQTEMFDFRLKLKDQ